MQRSSITPRGVAEDVPGSWLHNENCYPPKWQSTHARAWQQWAPSPGQNYIQLNNYLLC